MAIKKEQLKTELENASTPAGTYKDDGTQETQEKRKRQRRGEKLDLISFACPPQLLKESRRLAHYRQQTHSTLIQQILQEYIDAHREEIAAFDAVYKQLGKPLPNPNE